MQCLWSFLAEDQNVAVELPQQIKTERPSPAQSPASERLKQGSIAGESRCPHPEHEDGPKCHPISGCRSHRAAHVLPVVISLYLLLWVRAPRQLSPRRLLAPPHRRSRPAALLDSPYPPITPISPLSGAAHNLRTMGPMRRSTITPFSPRTHDKKTRSQEQALLQADRAATRVSGWAMYLTTLGR